MPPRHQHHRLPRLRPYMVLLLLCLAAYWPLTFSVFSVKNDAIHYFLPFRYQVSNAIQHGELPFWSPYLYLGYPLLGDMQSGAWNPFVWLISLFSTYNIYLFHLEYLLYIFIAGLGMYRLCRLFTPQQSLALLMAAAYMCCGYTMGSGQFINWIASAAFVPLVLEQYYRMLRDRRIIHALGTAVFIWLLLVCGYPADLVYTAYILAAMAVTGFVVSRRKGLRWQRWAGLHALTLLLAAGLCAPALLAFADLLPYYERGAGATYEQAVQNAYELKNAVSLLAPWTVTAPQFTSGTDLTGRNLFIGIVPLLLLLLSCFGPWKRSQIFAAGLLLFSFLFMLGEGYGLRFLTYQIFPGMSGFRHPSHFRLYVIIAALVMGVHAAAHGERKRLGQVTLGLLLICLVAALAAGSTHFLQWLQEIPFSTNGALVKAWLDKVAPASLTTAACLLQAVFLLAIFLLRKKRLILTVITGILNLLVFQALFPASFVGKTPPAVIHKVMRERIAEDRGLRLHTTVAQNSADAFRNFDTAGLSYFYNGRIGLSPVTNSPSFLSRQEAFLNHSFLYTEVASHPPMYLAHRFRDLRDTATLQPCVFLYREKEKAVPVDACRATGGIAKFRGGYNSFHATVEADTAMLLQLTQNYHHGWEATVDGKEVPVRLSNLAFMSIEVPGGTHQISWQFRPYMIYFAAVMAAITAISMLLYFLYHLTRRTHV